MQEVVMPPDNATITMTYAELAKRLKIKPASAKRLTQRHKWHRVIGNDGIALVHVPIFAFPDDVSGDISRDVADDIIPGVSPPVIAPVIPDLAPRVAHLEGLLEGLRGQLEAEQRRANAAETRILEITTDREAWRRQAQRSLWSRIFGSNGGG